MVMRCGCGIPSIELTGTLDDWKQLREKTEKLAQYDLEWWIKELLPVIDKFVEACQGKPDLLFWNSVCNIYGASGMSTSPISGWVQVFFPYLKSGRKIVISQNGRNISSHVRKW